MASGLQQYRSFLICFCWSAAVLCRVQRCINAEPNYGTLWVFFRSAPYDTPGEVFSRAKAALRAHLFPDAPTSSANPHAPRVPAVATAGGAESLGPAVEARAESGVPSRSPSPSLGDAYGGCSDSSSNDGHVGEGEGGRSEGECECNSAISEADKLDTRLAGRSTPASSGGDEGSSNASVAGESNTKCSHHREHADMCARPVADTRGIVPMQGGGRAAQRGVLRRDALARLAARAALSLSRSTGTGAAGATHIRSPCTAPPPAGDLRGTASAPPSVHQDMSPDPAATKKAATMAPQVDTQCVGADSAPCASSTTGVPAPRGASPHLTAPCVQSLPGSHPCASPSPLRRAAPDATASAAVPPRQKEAERERPLAGESAAAGPQPSNAAALLLVAPSLPALTNPTAQPYAPQPPPPPAGTSTGGTTLTGGVPSEEGTEPVGEGDDESLTDANADGEVARVIRATSAAGAGPPDGGGGSGGRGVNEEEDENEDERDAGKKSDEEEEDEEEEERSDEGEARAVRESLLALSFEPRRYLLETGVALATEQLTNAAERWRLIFGSDAVIP